MAGKNPDQLLVRRFMQALDAPLPIDTNPVAADLAMVLGDWATDSAVADINEDGLVDGADLAIVLGQWSRG